MPKTGWRRFHGGQPPLYPNPPSKPKPTPTPHPTPAPNPGPKICFSAFGCLFPKNLVIGNRFSSSFSLPPLLPVKFQNGSASYLILAFMIWWKRETFFNGSTMFFYPLKSNSVPVWAVPMYAVLLPIVIFLFVYFRRRNVRHHAVLGLLFSVLVTAVITDAIKNAVGRPRPDFFWRCFPDGKDVYDQLGNVICHGEKNVIKEGHESFPSGHSSWSFAGLGFLSLYLSGKIKAFDHAGHVAKLFLVFLPLLFASLVGISRVDDYWHHWEDVFAGGLGSIAAFCYLHFFPPPYHPEGWGPCAYFRSLEEASAGTQADNAQVTCDVQSTEAQVKNEEGQSCHGCVGLSLAQNHSSALDDIESGRR